MEEELEKQDALEPEMIAYWYLRLNGYMQIKDFIVHPDRRADGSARTDVDLIGVRFPHRKERLYDKDDSPMEDDENNLGLSKYAIDQDKIDVILVEVKKSGICRINGPWTNKEKENMQRVLSAVGCFPTTRKSEINEIANQLYDNGYYAGEYIRIRLVAIASFKSEELSVPRVTQIIWEDILGFLFDRFKKYGKIKANIDQWDAIGKKLRENVNDSNKFKNNKNGFIQWGLNAMSEYDH